MPSKIAQFILDLIFPLFCLSCGQEGNWLCPDCLSKIALVDRTPKIDPPLDRLFIACDYKNPVVKKLILNLKYNFIRDLAKPIGQLMSRRLGTGLDRDTLDSAVLIPVPLHKKRLRWRGFNQAELLAVQIGRELNLPVASDILIRRRHSPPQAKIDHAAARKANVKNSFVASPNSEVNLKNKIVILIDDISTTGATLTECAGALAPFQPRQIIALVFARG